MITREDINTAYKKGTQRTTGLFGSALLVESFDEMRNISEKLLAEQVKSFDKIESLERQISERDKVVEKLAKAAEALVAHIPYTETLYMESEINRVNEALQSAAESNIRELKVDVK